MSTTEAAQQLGVDRRTVREMIKRGDLDGGAQRRPQRMRWYVYAEALPASNSAQTDTSALDPGVSDAIKEARRQLAVASIELEKAREEWQQRYDALQRSIDHVAATLSALTEPE